MIYSKSGETLNWEDIKGFCQKRSPENTILEYKEDYPSHLEKVIAAMANTFGGVILIGIQEDDEGKPILPLKGIPFGRGHEERVTNIVLDNITPPVLPETIPIRDASGDRVIIVIRVPQSDQAPHAVVDNTRVYVRTGVRNNPETLATIERIGWLQDQRRKSVDLRDWLYDRTDQRVEFYLSQGLGLPQTESPSSSGADPAWLQLSLCPVYPREFLKTPSELGGIARAIGTGDYYGTFIQFPPSSRMDTDGKIVQDGLVYCEFDLGRFFYWELNSHGLYHYRQNVPNPVKGTELLCRLEEFLESGIQFCDKVGWRGLLQFRVDLVGIRGHTLNIDWMQWRKTEMLPCPDPSCRRLDTVPAAAIRANKKHLIYDSVQSLGWAFGWDIIPDCIDNFYESISPPVNWY